MASLKPPALPVPPPVPVLATPAPAPAPASALMRPSAAAALGVSPVSHAIPPIVEAPNECDDSRAEADADADADAGDDGEGEDAAAADAEADGSDSDSNARRTRLTDAAIHQRMRAQTTQPLAGGGGMTAAISAGSVNVSIQSKAGGPMPVASKSVTVESVDADAEEDEDKPAPAPVPVASKSLNTTQSTESSVDVKEMARIKRIMGGGDESPLPAPKAKLFAAAAPAPAAPAVPTAPAPSIREQHIKAQSYAATQSQALAGLNRAIPASRPPLSATFTAPGLIASVAPPPVVAAPTVAAPPVSAPLGVRSQPPNPQPTATTATAAVAPPRTTLGSMLWNVDTKSWVLPTSVAAAPAPAPAPVATKPIVPVSIGSPLPVPTTAEKQAPIRSLAGFAQNVLPAASGVMIPRIDIHRVRAMSDVNEPTKAPAQPQPAKSLAATTNTQSRVSLRDVTHHQTQQQNTSFFTTAHTASPKMDNENSRPSFIGQHQNISAHYDAAPLVQTKVCPLPLLTPIYRRIWSRSH